MFYKESYIFLLFLLVELEFLDYNICKIFILVFVVLGNGNLKEGSEEGLNVIRLGNEIKNIKVNDKEESEVMDIREEMDDVIEDDEVKNNGEDDDGDDDNVLVINNLI